MNMSSVVNVIRIGCVFTSGVILLGMNESHYEIKYADCHGNIIDDDCNEYS